MTSPSVEWEGLLLINKPSGPTTYDLIRWLKKNLKGVKIGHCGTLDPLASGLVILLLGRATKQQAQIMGCDKTYRCTMKLGLQTDSGDVTGQIIQRAEIPQISEDALEEKLNFFIGRHEQIPPMFSALKHKGKPLYKWARKGVILPRLPRSIEIKKLEFLAWSQERGELEIRVHVSSGTYIRTLAEDIGKKLGSCATLTALNRETLGPFSLEDALEGHLLNEPSLSEIKKRLIRKEVYA